MAERELKKKTTTAKQGPEVVEEAPAKSDQGEKIKAELDDLLDEIDDVLEVNAEEFVKAYVQKGGQ
ncbi:MAG: ubiquitin-like protein Pup [Acidimicrobiia bacterium]